MEIIFQTKKSKQILLFKILIKICLPALILVVLASISSDNSINYWIYGAPLIFLTWIGLSSLLVFNSHRFYIKQLLLNGDELEISYLHWCRDKKIIVKKSAIYFRLNDYRRNLKYFEIVQGDKLLLKQVPFEEWEDPTVVKKKLQDNGFSFKSYW